MNEPVRMDVADFSLVKEIMNAVPDGSRLSQCIQCGTCSGTCPAVGGMERTPRAIARMVQLGLVEQALRSEVFWNCIGCASCKLKCPRGIPLADLMMSLRTQFTKRVGPLDSMAQLSLTLERANNITGDSPENRLLWLDNMEQPALRSHVGRNADVGFFTGCVSSLFPMVYGIPQAFAQILQAAGCEFSIFGADEWCCGFPMIGAGMPDKLERLALHNVKALKEMGIQTLVTTCPSCFHTWKFDYPEIVGKLPFRVLHSSEFLFELIGAGKIKLGPLEETVTYHDPCDLGRKSGVYDAPREVLAKIPGLELREMYFNRENSKCCGGGANLEMINKGLSSVIAVSRVKQASETGAKIIASSCQQCKRTLQGAARVAKIKTRVLDVVELVARSIAAGSEEAVGT